MTDNTQKFVMKEYGKQSTFASFLPGIAGMKGIPIWCFYVNRGQAVVSFGVDHKDHAIMEFYPAHVAYQNVKRTGFRTFIKVDGHVVEAFRDENDSHEMRVGMNLLELSGEMDSEELRMDVTYFTLPEESVGALVRKVTITNLSEVSKHIELLDGMPAVIPYGVGDGSMKSMTQTAKAWMQAEDVESRIPFYRVRASMDDTASVSRVEGGNFAFAMDENGEKLPVIVDAEAVFGYDLSLDRPVVFEEGGLQAVAATKQNTSNLLPSAFFMMDRTLEAGKKLCFYELIGQVERHDLLDCFVEKITDIAFFNEKQVRATTIVDELVEHVATKTADERFDAYTKYTYMDNLLRGGYPIKLGHNKIFYVYSRKHGDLERDYNYFAMAPEFFSQGNGNFRDVNQNRRLDTFFAPFVGRENIRLFYSLIQLDGYNPLGIEKLSYHVEENKAVMILEGIEENTAQKITNFVTKPFHPGTLYRKLMDELEEHQVESIFTSLIDFAKQDVNANFGEGYWSDHWDYNLDLINEYLGVFPEQEEDMLYENAYSFFQSQVNINPRARRYEKTPNGIRQYHALNEASKRKTADKLVRQNFGNGQVLTTTLMGKLLLLCTTKFATLDPYGMGVEMEGGKPGWYDALNGMPGMLGSSMAETFELARMLDYTIGALQKYPRQVSVIKELGSLMEELDFINGLEQENLATKDEVISFWNRINDAKEIYREKTFAGVSGECTVFAADRLVEILKGFRQTVSYGIAKAINKEVCPTYFTYEVTNYKESAEGIQPTAFAVRPVPLFLEGPVRYLKLEGEALPKDKLYEFVKNSDLYDKKLGMYKVNASLSEASYELGRALAFTPGWLENESIWLHMEYKYLLELIKSGLYKEYAADIKSALVPFLDEKVYGRSTLENSSFIASSKNPNEKIHGKGFVARLSGSTIEFLNMWKIMMFGDKPFQCENGELTCSFLPTIPAYLIGEDKQIEATFLGKTKIVYELSDREDFFPGEYKINGMEVRYANKTVAQIKEDKLVGSFAEDLREGLIEKVKVSVCRK